MKNVSWSENFSRQDKQERENKEKNDVSVWFLFIQASICFFLYKKSEKRHLFLLDIVRFSQFGLFIEQLEITWNRDEKVLFRRSLLYLLHPYSNRILKL